MKKKIVIFASGEGTNAENIIRFFGGSEVEVTAVFCNNPKATVIARAHRLSVPSVVFSRAQFYHSTFILEQLQEMMPDLLVMAGFLWLVPEDILQAFPKKVINIHPALLPEFGGKGMFGKNVHKAVIEAGRNTSGITIHYLNEKYDEGQVIEQHACEVFPGKDTPETLAAKIAELEMAHFPKVIAQLLNQV